MSKQDAMTTCYDFVMLQFCGDISSEEWVNVMVIIREQETMNVKWEWSVARATALRPGMDEDALGRLLIGISNRLADVVSRMSPRQRLPTESLIEQVVSMPQNNWRWTSIRPGITRNLSDELQDHESRYLRVIAR